MRKRTIYITVICMLVIPVTAAVSTFFGLMYYYGDSVTPSAPHFPQPKNQAEAQRDDLKFLRGFLDADWGYTNELHAQAEAVIDQARNGPLPMSLGALALVTSRVAAIADNGHTYVSSSGLANKIDRIPIRSCILHDGVFIVRALPRVRELLGARIVAVNGYPIDALVKAMRSYVGGTTEWRDAHVPLYVEAPSMLRAAGFGVSDTEETVTVQRQGGSTKTVTLPALHDSSDGAAPRPCKNLQPQSIGSNKAGWVSALANRANMLVFEDRPNPFYRQPLSDVDGYYVRFDQNDNDDGVDIRGFAVDTMAALLAAQPKFVIVDMRFNSGGDYIMTASFMRGLPHKLPNARFYVMMSPLTFSAAITGSAFIKYEGGDRSLLVGDYPGDRVRSRAEGGEYCLPYSGICLMARTAIHDYSTTDCRPISQCFLLDRLFPVVLNSLKPDISAPLTFTALQDGHDPAIDAVLQREQELHQPQL